MSVWDVASRPAREQFGYWREVICEAFVPLAPSLLSATESFHSRVETRALPSVVRARLTSQPQRTAHGAREVSRTDGEYVFVNVQTAGTCAVQQRGRRAVVGPGRFTVVDTTEPYDFTFDHAWSMVSYRVPHRLLGGRLDAVRRLAGGCYEPRGAGGVVTAVMSSMWDLGDGPGAPEVELALASALSAVAGERLGVPGDPRAQLRREIERQVEAYLSDPSFGVAAVSRRLGISPRTLHSTVSAGGETFAAMVRRRRLHRAAALLAGAGPGVSISEIAASVGYDGPSSFSRAFRREFGRSPTDVRGPVARDARDARPSRTY